MKIKYLGTCAAEGFPALFCTCENCRNARAFGGKNYRSRSQAIIDDCLLIDFPADSYSHFSEFGIDLSKIHYCFITHIHGDHLYAKDFSYIKKGYSVPDSDYVMNIYGSVDLVPHLEKTVANSNSHLTLNILEPYKPTVIGDYTVTALKAYHGTENPYIYMIEKEGKRILYAHDTDYFLNETWEYLETNNFYLDLVSLDCTEGNMDDLNYHGHMCIGRNKKVRERMINSGLAGKETKFILNHFSHNGKDSAYDIFKPIAEKDGFAVSYDGFESEC